MNQWTIKKGDLIDFNRMQEKSGSTEKIGTQFEMHDRLIRDFEFIQ